MPDDQGVGFPPNFGRLCKPIKRYKSLSRRRGFAPDPTGGPYSASPVGRCGEGNTSLSPLPSPSRRGRSRSSGRWQKATAEGCAGRCGLWRIPLKSQSSHSASCSLKSGRFGGQKLQRYLRRRKTSTRWMSDAVTNPRCTRRLSPPQQALHFLPAEPTRLQRAAGGVRRPTSQPNPSQPARWPQQVRAVTARLESATSPWHER